MTEQAVIYVYGRVQMVGFRYFAVRQAKLHGISGYVKNLPNGSVEILAQGGSEALSSFIEAAEQGPSSAAIDRIQVNRTHAIKEHFGSFSIRW